MIKQKVSDTPWGTRIELDVEGTCVRGTLEQKRYKGYGPDTFGPVLRQPEGGTLNLNLSDEIFTTEEAIRYAEHKWDEEMARFKSRFGLQLRS